MNNTWEEPTIWCPEVDLISPFEGGRMSSGFRGGSFLLHLISDPLPRLKLELWSGINLHPDGVWVQCSLGTISGQSFYFFRQSLMHIKSLPSSRVIPRDKMNCFWGLDDSFLQVPLACLGSMAEGSWAGTSVQLWENSFQTSLNSSFCLLVQW